MIDPKQDYIDLFSLTKKAHMSKYMYMYDPDDLYERILKHTDYYPFKMERDIINQMSDRVCDHFQDIHHVLELGPGSQTPVLSKSIPFLRSLLSKVGDFNYTAIDSHLKYSEECRDLVKKHLPTLDVHGLEIDFLKQDCLTNLTEKSQCQEKKLVFTFGQCIFANNQDKEIKTLTKNISNFLTQGDYLLFGVDENQDPILLEKAYNNDILYQFLLNAMRFLKYKFKLKDFNPEEFTYIYNWNTDKRAVELSLKSTREQKIYLKGKEILISKDQEFHIMNSRRPSFEDIKKFLLKENIIIKERIQSNTDSSNKFSLVIAQKS